MSWTGVIVAAVFVGLGAFVFAFFWWEIPRWKRGAQAFMALAQLAEEKMAEDNKPKPPPMLSPDGMWWWDGQRWQPTDQEQRRPPT